MSENSNGRSLIIAAIIVSVAIVASAFVVEGALDRTTGQLELAVDALGDLEVAGGAPPSRPPRQRGPDLQKEHDVPIGSSPVLGNEDAVVTIVEWSDFQCPFCGRAGPTLEQVRKEYGDRVRIVFKHLPLSIHPQAPAAHAAAEAAHRQGKFWEMHDKIFANQRDLNPKTLERYAVEIGLDMDRFKEDVISDEVRKQIDADMAAANKLGVTGTPAFFINGRFLSGAQPFPRFKQLIDESIEKQS